MSAVHIAPTAWSSSKPESSRRMQYLRNNLPGPRVSGVVVRVVAERDLARIFSTSDSTLLEVRSAGSTLLE
eukprot:14667828-Heterocapsa_arctica.AAC.1